MLALCSLHCQLKHVLADTWSSSGNGSGNDSVKTTNPEYHYNSWTENGNIYSWIPQYRIMYETAQCHNQKIVIFKYRAFFLGC
jgi:hypothetical protein